MFPSFHRYKEGTGGRGQIEPGPPVIFQALNSEKCIANFVKIGGRQFRSYKCKKMQNKDEKHLP